MIRLALFFALGLVALSPSSVFADDGPLDVFKGEKRALLLFSRSRSTARLDKQVDLLRERRPDLKDRDLVVLVIAGTQDTAMAIGYARLRSGTNRQLRKEFEVDNTSYLVVLVGKDGKEKGRWSALVEPDEIFDLIDSLGDTEDEVQESRLGSN